MRRITVARSPYEIELLRGSWEQLPARSMFQSFSWNYTAACAFWDREAPFVVYAENDNGAALIPAAIDQNQLRVTLLGESLFDYRTVLAAGDYEVALQSAWQEVAQLRLDFSTGAIRSDAGDDAFRQWQGFDLNRSYSAPRVSPDEISGDAFSAEHGRLGQLCRRFEREGVNLHVHNGENDLVRCIYAKKGTRPAETGDNLFDDPRRVYFMAEVCRASGDACDVFTLESAGTLVAALVTFRDVKVRRFYTVYFDPAWAKYSPGMVLVNEVTRRSLAEGIECDYMTGEHGYKMRFATSVVPMYWAAATAERMASMGALQPALAA